MASRLLLFAVLFVAIFNVIHSEVATNGKGWWYPPGELMYGIYKQEVAYSRPYSYLFGGLRSKRSLSNSVNASCLLVILKNDAVSHSSEWISLSPLNSPDLCHFESDSGDLFARSSVTVDNTVYFAGHGLNGEIYSFNLSSETWINGEQNNQLSPMPFPIEKGCTVTNQTHIMVFGGVSNNEILESKLQIYDVEQNAWTSQTIPMTINSPHWAAATRQWMAQMCSLVDNAVYIFGGQVNVYSGNAIGVSNSRYVYKYMTKEETWHNVTQFEYGKDSGWAVHYKPNNLIYLFSARNAAMKYWIFDVESERILGSASSMSEVEYAPALYVEETNQIMVFGGEGTNYYSDQWGLQETIQIWNVSWVSPSHNKGKHQQGLYLGIGIGTSVITLVLVVVGVMYCRRSKEQKSRYAYLLNE